jgi:hypothetical protein
MNAWHAKEAAPSVCQAAIDMIRQSNKQFQSNSYFGYLDAEKMDSEAEEKARSAIDIQQTQLDNIIH